MLEPKVPEVEEEVLALYASQNSGDEPTLITSLWLVQDAGQRVHMLRELLTRNPALANARRTTTMFSKNVLELAVQHRDIGSMRALLEHGAKATADLVSAALPDAVMVDLLASHVGDGLGVMGPMTAPLEHAMENGYSTCATILQRHGAVTSAVKRDLSTRLARLHGNLWGTGGSTRDIMLRLADAAAVAEDRLTPQEVHLMVRTTPKATTLLETMLLVHQADRAAVLDYVLQHMPVKLHSLWATALVVSGDLECSRILLKHLEPSVLLNDLVKATAMWGPARLAMLEMVLPHVDTVPGDSLPAIVDLALQRGHHRVLHMLVDKGLAADEGLILTTAADNITRVRALQMLVDEGLLTAPVATELLQVAIDVASGVQVLQLLLQAGADPEQAAMRADLGRTPALDAAVRIHREDQEWSVMRRGWVSAVARAQLQRRGAGGGTATHKDAGGRLATRRRLGE
jgi:hypothetical protein